MARINTYPLTNKPNDNDVFIIDSGNGASPDSKTRTLEYSQLVNNLNSDVISSVPIDAVLNIPETSSQHAHGISIPYSISATSKIIIKGCLSVNGGYLFGYKTTQNNVTYQVNIARKSPSAPYYRLALTNGGNYDSNVPVDGKPHVFEITNTYWKIDGKLQHEFSTPETGYLENQHFALLNMQGAVNWYYTAGGAKIYSVEIYESGLLSCSLVPYIIVGSGETGFYDTCTKARYTPSSANQQYYIGVRDATTPTPTQDDVFGVPTYWVTKYTAAVKKVRAIRKQHSGKCFSFVYWSDMHIGVTGQYDRYKYAGTLAAALCRDLPINFVAILGDNIDGSYTDSTDTVIDDQLYKLREIIRPIPSDKLILLHGNHDGCHGYIPVYTEADEVLNEPRVRYIDGVHKTTYPSPDWATTPTIEDPYNKPRYAFAYQFSKSDMHEMLLSNMVTNSNAVFGEDGTYFYLDFPRDKFRVFGLNSFWSADDTEIGSGTSAHAKIFDRMHHGGLGEAQIKFIRDHMAELTSDWKVIFLSHNPFDRILGDGATSDDIYRDYRDAQVIRGLLGGCIDHVSGTTVAFDHRNLNNDNIFAKLSGNIITGETGDLASLNDWANVSALPFDFSNNSPTIAAFIAGHNHQDHVHYMTTNGSGTVLAGAPATNNSAVNTAPKIRIVRANGTNYPIGTDNECAMDIVTVCYDTNQVYIVRLGADGGRGTTYEDGRIRYGNVSNLSSAEKSLLVND